MEIKERIRKNCSKGIRNHSATPEEVRNTLEVKEGGFSSIHCYISNQQIFEDLGDKWILLKKWGKLILEIDTKRLSKPIAFQLHMCMCGYKSLKQRNSENAGILFT